MTENLEVDVAVIGAGIAGTGVAAALGPDVRVAVLEMEERPGHHTTGRSAAMFIQNYGNAVIRALSRVSAPLFEQGDPELFHAPLLSPRGMLNIAGEADRHEHDALLAQSEGLREITPDEAVAMVPVLRREAIVAASYEADARDIDVAGLHQGWQKAVRRAGGRIVTRAPVTSARRERGRWVLQAGAATVSAPVVVNAAGAWADGVAKLFGAAPLGLQPMRRTIAVVAVPAGCDARRWPLMGDAGESWYAKPDGGRLFVSPADEDPVEPHDAFPDDMVMAEGLFRFEQAVTFPVTHVERSWAGLRTFAPDRTPVAGYDPAVEGFFWLAGQGGYGIQTSPALSRLAARLIRREAPEPQLTQVVQGLSPARFGAANQQSEKVENPS